MTQRQRHAKARPECHAVRAGAVARASLERGSMRRWPGQALRCAMYTEADPAIIAKPAQNSHPPARPPQRQSSAARPLLDRKNATANARLPPVDVK